LDPAAATVAAYPKNSLILCSWAHDWRKSLPYLLTSPTKTFPVIPILLPIHNLVLAAFHRRTPPPLLLPLRHPHPRATSSWLPSSASREEANGRRRRLAGIVGGGLADRAAPPCDVPHGGSDRAVLPAPIRFRAGVGSHADNTHTRRPAHNNFHHVLGFVQCRLSPPGIAVVLPRSPQMIPCERLHAIRLDRSAMA
jgi:hypothetical protein